MPWFTSTMKSVPPARSWLSGWAASSATTSSRVGGATAAIDGDDTHAAAPWIDRM
jgi:hypothetical protein